MCSHRGYRDKTGCHAADFGDTILIRAPSPDAIRQDDDDSGSETTKCGGPCRPVTGSGNRPWRRLGRGATSGLRLLGLRDAREDAGRQLR